MAHCRLPACLLRHPPGSPACAFCTYTEPANVTFQTTQCFLIACASHHRALAHSAARRPQTSSMGLTWEPVRNTESWAPLQTHGARISLSGPRKPFPTLRADWDPILLVLSSSLNTPYSAGCRCGHIHLCLPAHRVVNLLRAAIGPGWPITHSTQHSASCVVVIKKT